MTIVFLVYSAIILVAAGTFLIAASRWFPEQTKETERAMLLPFVFVSVCVSLQAILAWKRTAQMQIILVVFVATFLCVLTYFLWGTDWLVLVENLRSMNSFETYQMMGVVCLLFDVSALVAFLSFVLMRIGQAAFGGRREEPV